MAARMPQVNHHVILYLSGGGTKVRVKPGTITAVTNINTINVRVGKTGGTHVAVVRKVRLPNPAHANLPSWTPA